MAAPSAPDAAGGVRILSAFSGDPAAAEAAPCEAFGANGQAEQGRRLQRVAMAQDEDVPVPALSDVAETPVGRNWWFLAFRYNFVLLKTRAERWFLS